MLNAVVTGMIAITYAVSPMAAPGGTGTAARPTAGVEVAVVTVNGSGCPAGEGAAVLNDELDVLTITAPAYFAWVGGGARPTDFRKNCQFSVQITRPAGWTYAVTQVRSGGFTALADGATGLSRVALYFQGSSATTTLSNTFTGPSVDRWDTTDTIAPAEWSYAPCGVERNLNINTELRVGLGTSPATTSSFLIREPTSSYR
ncbi:MAG TPA: DUF4360 domain-containing protein, partial [Actinoplanes sp.]